MTKRKPMQVRISPDVDRWIAEQAARFGTSKNAEIVRSIVERMERENAAQARAK